jgi:tetratricopeptide (TPR) repeat protein
MDVERNNSEAVRAYIPWWLVSLLVATSVALTVALAIFLPYPWGVLILILFLLVLVGTTFFNPTFRYKLAYEVIVASWLSVHSIPSIEIWIPSVKDNPLFRISNEVIWSFDIAFAVVAVTLLILDFFVRLKNKPSFSLDISAWRFFSSNHSTNVETGGQQVDVGGVSGNNNQISITLTQSVPDFNAEIDVAAKYLEEFRPDIALEKLSELKRHHWSKMTDREKFRVTANLGNAFNQIDEFSAAADHYLEAIQYQPVGEESQSLEATAYFLQGKDDEAIRCAKNLLQRLPGNKLAQAVLIRASSDAIETDSLANAVPAHLRKSLEILDALFHHASRRKEYPHAEAYARQIMAIDQRSQHAKMRLGSILASKSIDGRLGRISCSSEEVRELANEAITLLTEFIAGETPSKFFKGYSRYHRALAYEAVDRNDEAEADLRSANEILPNDQVIRYQLGIFLVSHDKNQLAIEHFESGESLISLSHDTVVLSRLLLGRNKAGDLDRVCAILLEALKADAGEDTRLTFEALLTLAETLGLQGKTRQAEESIAKYGNSLPLAYVHTLKGSCYARAQDFPNANLNAMSAKNNLLDTTELLVRYKLGELFARLKNHSEAVEVYKTIANLNAFGEAIELVLESAWIAEDYKFILRVCESVKQSGQSSIPICEIEIATLERLNELPRAVARIDECLTNFDDDRFLRKIRLRKAVIGKISNNPALLTFDPNLLPLVSDSEISEACNTALILYDGPDPWVGIRFAYELVRRRFDEPKAHQCLLSIAGPKTGIQFPFHDVVEIGCAVAYVEGEETAPKWIILEDGANPSPNRCEQSPNSEIAKELLGKKVGDLFYIRRGLQDRIGTIQEVVGKIMYRVSDSLVNWEERFRDVKYIQAYKFKKHKNGDLDVADIVETLSRLDEPRQEIESLYRREFLSVGMFSTLMREPVVDSIGYLANHAEMPIRCCLGSGDEYANARADLDGNKLVVIDPSGLATVFLLGIWDPSRKITLGNRFLVSTGTLQCFRTLLKNPFSPMYSRILGKNVRKEHVYETRTQDEINRTIDAITGFIAWVESNTSTIGGLGLAEFTKEQRHNLGRFFDSATIESLGTAIARNAILWTDDFAIASSGFVEGILLPPRTWTAVVVEELSESGGLTHDQRSEFLLDLIGFDYRFTRLDQAVFDLAMKKGRWNPIQGSLADVLRWIAVSGVSEEGALQTAAEIIRRVWSQALLAHQRSEVAAAAVKSLSQRPDGVAILQQLESLLPIMFGLDVPAIRECRQLIRNEQAFLLRGKMLVLPDDPDWPR